MINHLREVSRSNGKVYIWGTGKNGKKYSYILAAAGVYIEGYFDNAYPSGACVNGMRICPIDTLSVCDKDNIYVVIACQYRNEVFSKLCELGIKNIIDMKDIGREYRSEFPKIEFNTVTEPDVSILVTAFNEWQYTYNMFDSLAKHKIDVAYEIILGDDVSTDMNSCAEKYLDGVKVVHNKERMNYLGNVNNIASMAKGKYILLLANDTIVLQDNWIDKMYDIMENNPDYGMLSGRYWMPISQSYDTAFNYGKDLEAVCLEPDANMQSVQFVWPIATMVRKSVWDAIGGFSKEYLPAFCEDNDLCMKVIEAGYKCVYTPDITTIHFYGVSYSKNPTALKLFDEHQRMFRDKWGDFLSSHRQ